MTAAEKRALAARLRALAEALAEVPTQGGHNADRALQQLEYDADQQERKS